MIHLKRKKIILGSKSPRRIELLKSLGIDCEVRVSDADETAPEELSAEDTVEWVAKVKAEALRTSLHPNEILITADTEVWKNNRRYGKPGDRDQAIEMIQSLSGTTHKVISGLCVCDLTRIETLHVSTKVHFRNLSLEEIEHYVDTYKPYDKAGSYGIQEWIGMIGISSIEGSFYNVMGLPTSELWTVLKRWMK